ncbi:MAG: transcriptional repressor [Coriobacteriales bacterium]|nr:transcriptional repressor [Coriobacteriales bacterium]
MGKRPSRYTTRQGEAIRAYLKSQHSRYLTAAQIAAHFEVSIGRTTVYRQLDKLVREGLARKYSMGDGSPARFQFVAERKDAGEHYHLVCGECGELVHLEAEELAEVSNGILREYAFAVDVSKTVFYGTCGQCVNKMEVNR